MANFEWKFVGVSVAGFSHQAEGIPCEDSHRVSSFANGWLVGIVSDGAGSARRSAEGSRMLCETLLRHLTPFVEQFQPDSETCLEPSQARLLVSQGVEAVRSSVAEISQNDPLSAFHATLLGTIAGPFGGCFFHLGDGAAFAAMSSDFSQAVFSHPENGEYANETHFFTESDWQQHLRLTLFDGQYDLIALMTDGVTPFALGPRAIAAHEPFFGPLSNYLSSHTTEEGQRALAATLEKDAIRRITGDDKTLVWALRQSK